MQKISLFLSLNSLAILALTFALPACDEPIEDDGSLAQDDEDEAPRTGQIVLEDGTELTYVVKNGNAFFEDDILLGDADELETSFRSAGSTVFPGAAAWPGGVVHFQIQPGFQSAYLVPAIQDYESKTKIRFINAPDAQGKYVLIGNFGPGCYANYGRPTAQAFTRLNIGEGCDNFQTWVHEFGHVVGLYHEHTRTDRDKHIDIHWNNIDPQVDKSNFKKWKKNGLMGADIGPYDYKSVMHYSSRMGAKDDGNPYTYTMTRKDNGQPIFASPTRGLSKGDVQGVTFLYGGI